MTRRLLFLFVALCLLALQGRAADAGLEYKVKAVCVLNAARYVQWPASVFEDATAPIVIGVLGENPFGSLLKEAVKNESVHRRTIRVREVTIETAAKCQLLFVSRSEKDRLASIITALDSAHVLTVSDMEGFTHAGGVLGLALEDGKIRFDLNAKAARQAGLNIEPQFLMLCRMRP